jgi:hypothetical protein
MQNIEILSKLTHKHPPGLEFTKIGFKLYTYESAIPGFADMPFFQTPVNGHAKLCSFACPFTGVWKKGLSAKPGMERDVGELVPHSSRQILPRHFQAVSLFSLA